MGKLQVIVGGQAGSEAKGHVAAQLASPELTPEGLAAVRVAGPNAGHSAVDATGRKWALRQIPVAAVIKVLLSAKLQARDAAAVPPGTGPPG